MSRLGRKTSFISLDSSILLACVEALDEKVIRHIPK
jgi:hypothetical protein